MSNTKIIQDEVIKGYPEKQEAFEKLKTQIMNMLTTAQDAEDHFNKTGDTDTYKQEIYQIINIYNVIRDENLFAIITKQ